MQQHEWIEELPVSVMVCDRDGILLEMNLRAADAYQKEGGHSLVGRSLLECHPEPARTKLTQMLESGQGDCYIIEKEGTKKMILLTPWYSGAVYRGLVALSFELSGELPHFVREPSL
jgi:hypothetical protein